MAFPPCFSSPLPPLFFFLSHLFHFLFAFTRKHNGSRGEVSTESGVVGWADIERLFNLIRLQRTSLRTSLQMLTLAGALHARQFNKLLTTCDRVAAREGNDS
eukprot:GHVU01064769.1.p1 GENE.GHVU01064769.1~~GHVU01064769.1.p1  ORF type:complete len:102 (-),score=2.33 GHVU01064769.1:909-1214(-)